MLIYDYDNKKTYKVILVKEKSVLLFIKIIFPFEIVLFSLLIPVVIKILSTDMGTLRLMLAVDSNPLLNGLPGYTNLLILLYAGLENVITIVAFYAYVFVKQSRMLIKYFFISAVIFPIVFSLVAVMRSYMMFHILQLIFLLIIFKSYIPKVILRKIVLIGASVLSIIVILMTIISFSRFSDDTSFQTYRYAGEMFLNFSGALWPDLRGTTGGTAYFQVFNRLLGGEGATYTTLADKWNYIDGITKIDSHIFYGYIGGLIIEFGFVFAFIIYSVLSLILSCPFIKHKRPVFSLPNLLILGALAHLLISGAYMFVYQGPWGNREIIFFVLVYIYFKCNNEKTSKIQ